MQIERYKKIKSNNLADSTLNSRLSALRKLDSFIDSDEPSVSDVEDWVEHMIDEYQNDNMSSGTVKAYYNAAKYYFSTIKGEDNALDHIQNWLPERKTDHGDFLEEDEWSLLLNETYSYRLKAMLEVMYTYARRPNEVRLLNKEDVDFKEETITFNILKKLDTELPHLKLYEDGEVDEEFRVFRATFELKEDVGKALRRYMNHSQSHKQQIQFDDEEKETVTPLFTTGHGRVTYATIWENIKSKTQELEIDKNITPKSMRHSRTTHLHWSGRTPEEISSHQLLHEPDSDVVSAYIHPKDEEQVRGVMDTLDKDDE